MITAIIAEKPSVAKDIANVLNVRQRHDGYLSGNDYLVTWAFGHLVQLASPMLTGLRASAVKTFPSSRRSSSSYPARYGKAKSTNPIPAYSNN